MSFSQSKFLSSLLAVSRIHIICISVYKITYIYICTFIIFVAYYTQAVQAKSDLGEDTTDVLISLSNAYSKMGDNNKAEQVLNSIA